MTPVECLLQVVETGAALTWAFFAFPTRHFDEKTPILQASHAHPHTGLLLSHNIAITWWYSGLPGLLLLFAATSPLLSQVTIILLHGLFQMYNACGRCGCKSLPGLKRRSKRSF